jgi:hypothetical protein
MTLYWLFFLRGDHDPALIFLSFSEMIMLTSVWFSSLVLQMQELARYRDQFNPLNGTVH